MSIVIRDDYLISLIICQNWLLTDLGFPVVRVCVFLSALTGISSGSTGAAY